MAVLRRSELQDSAAEGAETGSTVSTVGFALLALAAALVPIAVFPWLVTMRSSIVMGKTALLAAFGVGILGCAAVSLWTTPPNRLPRFGATTLLLALLAGWTAVAVLFSEDVVYAFRAASVALIGIGIAASMPLFVTSARRQRTLLLAMAAGMAFTATVAVASKAGWRGWNRFAYGRDPREVLEDENVRRANAQVLEGGYERGAVLASFGNPEHAGGYLAVAAALAGAFAFAALFDTQAGVKMRVAAVLALLLALAALASTETRSGWLALLAAAMARWWLAVRQPGWLLAAFVATGAVAALSLGAFGALGVGAAATLWLALATLRAPEVRALPSKAKVAAGTLLLALVVTAAWVAVPGPWNGGDRRVLERFRSLASVEDHSVRERLLMYMIASEQVAASPLVGVGPGFYGPQFYPALRRLVEVDDSGALDFSRIRLQQRVAEFSHNDYFQWAAEAGLPALLLLLGAIVAALSELGRALRQGGEGARIAGLLAAPIAATLVSSVFSGPMQFPDRALVFWLLLGAAAAMRSCAAPVNETPS